jgi:hypothetical protein
LYIIVGLFVLLLLAIVLSVLLFMASDYPFGIWWPLYCLSFYLWLLITPLVSCGHCIVCPFIYGFWLPPFGIFKLVLQVINHAGKRWCLDGLWMDIKLQWGGRVDKAEKLCHLMSHLPLPSNLCKGPTCARCLTCNEYGILKTQGSHLHPILRVSCCKVADTPSIGFKSPLCVYPRSPPPPNLSQENRSYFSTMCSTCVS